MKKNKAALFILILCTSLVAAPMGIWAQGEDPVAKVNGVVITRAEFLEILEQDFGIYALQELIQQELIRQKAEAMQVSIDEEEFDFMYSYIIHQLGGDAALQMFLMQNGATEEQFIEQLRGNMLVAELAASEVEVTEEAVEEWFARNSTYYDRPETVETSHILVETEEEAQEILALLEAGESFFELAKDRSLDPGSAKAGGYLGKLVKGETVPEFENLAFSLPVDEYGLTESDFGWHIILIHEKTEAMPTDLADIYDTVVIDYRSDLALDAQSYMYKLESEAELEIFWPNE